ncbi:sigma-70 family RNA polymerase sigma factor [Pseudenhygromyxa sp. WMMC2535]|uniref:RNA polymerase sigma factor n=1 Tax=Pseudenhygromyxa sp. WMMC2535 TaxID=2712867 RepID=UPI001553ED32|nr:sigma-70 family RNA polymerase sigma factor [Pseudenhygromyxa sp. WMMC2535]NVB38537.1 sigma-70 family RNA polymerase sigma factor [Pseudenhygromyxa sp. WMMC2535]
MNQAPNQQLATVARENWPKLKRFFKAKVPEPDCYDLTQETLLHFVRTDPAGIRNPKAYLWGIARNRLFSYFGNKRPTERFESSKISVAELGGTLSSQLDRRQRLANALSRLPVDHQIAFELRFCEELKLEEVAESMQVSLATVKRYLNKAREQLRELLTSPEFADARANEDKVIDAYRTR